GGGVGARVGRAVKGGGGDRWGLVHGLQLGGGRRFGTLGSSCTLGSDSNRGAKASHDREHSRLGADGALLASAPVASVAPMADPAPPRRSAAPTQHRIRLPRHYLSQPLRRGCILTRGAADVPSRRAY